MKKKGVCLLCSLNNSLLTPNPNTYSVSYYCVLELEKLFHSETAWGKLLQELHVPQDTAYSNMDLLFYPEVYE